MRMALFTSNSQAGLNMGSSSGYTGYPGPPGVPGLGIPPPVPSLGDYRNNQPPPHLISHHLHSLPTPQPQPLGLPVPETTTYLPRNVPSQRQISDRSYNGSTAKDVQGSMFSTHPNFEPSNRSQPYNTHPSHPMYQGGHSGSNWRDHLTHSATSPNSMPQNRPYNSVSGNTPVSGNVSSHRPSPSLSSSSDQRSVGSGNRLPIPPPKPPKSQPQSHSVVEPSRSVFTSASGEESVKHDVHEDEEEESDWEKEISEQGDVFYVVPYMTSDRKSEKPSDQFNSLNRNQINKTKDSNITGADKSGKKLSRLVRRRESKRDRGSSGGNLISHELPEKSKIPEKSDNTNDDFAETNRKSISLLPAGIKSASSAGFIQTNNSSHESSDNDSSTYGQIKTFEEFVEGGVISSAELGIKPKKKMSTTALKNRVALGLEKQDSSDDDPASITELHEVTLKINAKQLKPQLPHFRMALDSDNPTHAGILLDAILGIAAEKRDEGELGVIVVRGYIPNRGSAIKAGDRGELLIGDIIRSMDGQHVTMDSVNSFLVHKLTNCSSSQRTTTVKLTLQRPIVKFKSQRTNMQNTILTGVKEIDDSKVFEENHVQGIFSQSSYLKMISGLGPSPSETQSLLSHLPHMLLYVAVTGVKETASELEDVLYTYPSETPTQPDSSTYRLFKSRGVFVTLCQLLGQVTGDGEKPTVTSVLLDGTMNESGGGGSVFESQLMHIAYEEENGDLLLLALPGSKYSSKDTHEILKNFARVLRLQFGGSLAKTFSHRNSLDNQENSNLTNSRKHELDKLISGLFLNIFVDTNLLFEDTDSVQEQHNNCTTGIPVSKESVLPVSQWLLLPVDIQFQVEDAINQLESADFRAYSGDIDNGDMDEFYDAPREFHILGSCLFHRGLLVSTHLSKTDTVDILLWLKANRNILAVSSKHPVRRVVAWKEIYPSKETHNDTAMDGDAHKRDSLLGHSQGNYNSDRDSSSRSFILVVGLGYQLLAVMLENGVGGCTDLQSSGITTIRPDPFYVDQAASTLEHLEEMGIPLVCEKWLTLPSNPDVLDVDQFYQKTTRNKKSDGFSTTSQSSLAGAGTGGIVLRRTKSVDHMKEERISITSSEESEVARQISYQKGTENDLIRHHRESSCSTSEYSEEMQTAFRGDDVDESTSEKKIPKDVEEESKSESVWEVPKSGVRTRHNYTPHTSGSASGMQGTNLNASHEGKSSISSATSSYKKYLDQQMASSNSYKASDVIEEDNAEFVTYRISQLSVSFETTIFHYCHLNIGQGVYLSPLKASCDNAMGNHIPGKREGPLHQQFMANFQSACQIIHSTFKVSQRSRETSRPTNQASGDPNRSNLRPWRNKTLVGIKEQAMLFHWTPTTPLAFNKKGAMQPNVHHLPTLSYWVCGRVFDNSVVSISSAGATSSTPSDTTECYVAYHDSAPQNMIELAFRIAFGIHV